MERRVPPGSRDVLPGVTLKVSVMGGCSVECGGDYIGWIHASIGDRWNAYARRPGTSGEFLGRYTQDEAVRVIVAAWHSGAVLPNGCRP